MFFNLTTRGFKCTCKVNDPWQPPWLHERGCDYAAPSDGLCDGPLGRDGVHHHTKKSVWTNETKDGAPSQPPPRPGRAGVTYEPESPPAEPRCGDSGAWTDSVRRATEGKSDGLCDLPRGHDGMHRTRFSVVAGSRDQFKAWTSEAKDGAPSQPPPRPGRAGVTAELRQRFLEWFERKLDAREAYGVAKYGTTLQTWNGRDPTMDELEELIDALQYRLQAHMEREEVMQTLEGYKRWQQELITKLGEERERVHAWLGENKPIAPTGAGVLFTERTALILDELNSFVKEGPPHYLISEERRYAFMFTRRTSDSAALAKARDCLNAICPSGRIVSALSAPEAGSTSSEQICVVVALPPNVAPSDVGPALAEALESKFVGATVAE